MSRYTDMRKIHAYLSGQFGSKKKGGEVKKMEEIREKLREMVMGIILDHSVTTSELGWNELSGTEFERVADKIAEEIISLINEIWRR